MSLPRYRVNYSCMAGLLLWGLMAGACANEGRAANQSRASSPAKQRLTILSGFAAGSYYEVAAALVGIYRQQLPGTMVTLATSGGSARSMDSVEAGEGDLTFGRSDVVYLAFREGTERNPRPYTHLRSIANLNANAIHIVVRQAAGIRDVRGLRGRRVSIGLDPSGGRHARSIIESYGLTINDLKAESIPNADAAIRLKNGTLDAAFFALGIDYPVPIVTDISESTPIRLLPIDESMLPHIRSRLPFFKPVVIPGGTYHGQPEAVRTVGVDNIVVCRDSLPEELVYNITRLLFEALPGLSREHVMVRMMNPEHAAATPIPLHEGAARYYRERELFR